MSKYSSFNHNNSTKAVPLRDCTQARQSLENQRNPCAGSMKGYSTEQKFVVHNPYGVKVLGESIDEEFAAAPSTNAGIHSDRIPSSRPVPIMLAGNQTPEIYYPTQHYYYPGSGSSPMAFGSLSRVYQNGRPVPVLAATGRPLITSPVSSWHDVSSESSVDFSTE